MPLICAKCKKAAFQLFPENLCPKCWEVSVEKIRYDRQLRIDIKSHESELETHRKWVSKNKEKPDA